MALTRVLLGFGVILIIIAAAMTGPMALAFALGEESAGSYLFGAVITLFAGLGALSAGSARKGASDFRSALIIIMLWWVGAPAFAAIPLAHDLGNFGDAYFEAVSALTTTGAWLSQEAIPKSPASLLWRAELQWLGGLASLTIAAAIFIRPTFIGIDTLLPPFSRGDEASYLHPLRNAVTAFLPVYSFITFIAFIAIALAGAPVLDAAVMAMSIVATGGMAPHEAGIAGYPPIVSAVIFPLMVLSGANFVLIARVLRGDAARVRDIESGAYILIVVWVGVLFWVFAGAENLTFAAPAFFNAASVVSTSGYVIGQPPPLIPVLITAMIGAAAVSTAGGFKIIRWLVITRRAREEIRRITAPKAVFGASQVTNELGVWMHFLVFTLILGVLLICFAVGGHPIETAATAAVAAFSNAGPLLALADGASGDYAMFDGPLKAVLIVGMILGRLEAAVALALVNLAFWRS
ncbi:MAG: potassium transporter TrkG [Pseudomonadota bacterium]